MSHACAHGLVCPAATGLRDAAIALTAVSAVTSAALAEQAFRKLTPTQITARLGGMEITDGVHWAEQYMRDGTFKAFHMGKASTGKWYVRNGELCLAAAKAEAECKEVWLSGTKRVEFRVPGSALPPMEGVVQKQEPRN